jgi:hypothetical protein
MFRNGQQSPVLELITDTEKSAILQQMRNVLGVGMIHLLVTGFRRVWEPNIQADGKTISAPSTSPTGMPPPMVAGPGNSLWRKTRHWCKVSPVGVAHGPICRLRCPSW